MGSPSRTPWIWGANSFAWESTLWSPWKLAPRPNLVRVRRLGNLNQVSEKHGPPQLSAYPARTRLEFGGGRHGEARFTADLPGSAGCRGELAASVTDAGIPAILRKGAVEALGGQSQVARDMLTLRNQGADIPPKVNQTGRNILNAVAVGEGRPRSGRRPAFPASYFEWASVNRRPNIPDGG